MDHNTLFAKTPPGKLFVLAALPGAIGMLASALYQLIDGILVGQVLGDTAFAAINLAMPFVIINFALADLIGVGSAVPISVRLGQKEEKAANNIFTCACLMIVGTGALIGAVLFFAAPLLFQLLGAEPELAALAVQYLRVYALLSPLTTIIFASDNYLRICGKIRMSMWLNILMSILTAVLEFFLLAVLKWGIWAAALASSLGMIACVAIALYPFARGKLQLKFCRPRFSVSMVKQIVACGSPNFLNNISGRVTSIIMNAVLLRVGGQNAVSIYGILMYVDGLIQPLMYGCCDSLQPAVSYNWGAGSKGRILAIEKYCFSAAAVISLLSAVVMFLFPDQITALFLSGMDEGFLATARTAIQLFAFTYVTRWFSFACQSFMTALERAGGGIPHLHLHRPDLPGSAAGRPVPLRAHRHLAELRGELPAGGDSGRAPAPALLEEALENRLRHIKTAPGPQARGLLAVQGIMTRSPKIIVTLSPSSMLV